MTDEEIKQFTEDVKNLLISNSINTADADVEDDDEYEEDLPAMVGIKRFTISAVVTRADGTVEDLGIISDSLND